MSGSVTRPRDKDAKADTQKRRRRYRLGHFAERVACIWLMIKGYRILAVRARTPAGEIDLVALRGKRLAFIEVKRRPTLQDAEASITGKQRQRVRNAASLWIARQPRFHDHDIGFDLVFLIPGSWPRHLENAL